MKAKLKHASGQYVLIIDERPKIGDYYLYNGFVTQRSVDYGDEYFYKFTKKVIAAENLKGVKEIRFGYYHPFENKYEVVKPQDRFFESFIDTELEVTEEEEYYIVRL